MMIAPSKIPKKVETRGITIGTYFFGTFGRYLSGILGKENLLGIFSPSVSSLLKILDRHIPKTIREDASERIRPIPTLAETPSGFN
ncbi:MULTISPECIES: hypothetical protein [Streptococcus]|uniref:hypothetical protein n=1 Tax=Streptococcus TaxID=1301 RepID=UPI0013E044C2|nr:MULTISPECIES: hypothetical protein [Streptococcus]